MTTIVIVGDYFGDAEFQAKLPFVGPPGKLLNGLLHQVGIRREDCYLTNVFNLQPPNNKVEDFCGPKAEAIPGYPAAKTGKYIRSKYAPELARLYREIQVEAPNLVIALGATAAWALLGTAGIKKIRGAPGISSPIATTAVGKPFKVLPTYHPSAVQREWTLRPIVISDLEKAKREAVFPELRRPERFIHIEPSIDDLLNFEHDYILPSDSLSIDIETAGEQITCIGFAPTVDRAIVVPFLDTQHRDGNYWRNPVDEKRAWAIVRRWCQLDKRIVMQNGLFDMNFLYSKYGIPVPHATDDTMLLHHALQPELQKGLGFLATIYSNELPWKFMRESSSDTTLKKEDI